MATKPKLDFRKTTKRMNFHVFGSIAEIWVSQTWVYSYVVKNGAAKWTAKEKRGFHDEIEKAIRKSWNGKFVLEAKGTSEFATALAGKPISVNFDLSQANSGGHWKVTATKVPKGSKSPTSTVNWGKQEIQLDTEDMHPASKKGAPDGVKMVPAAHEFGHAIGNSSATGVGHWDEYRKSSKFKKQLKSIMNLGNKVKKRHADYLIGELNKIIPDTTFSVKSVK